MKKSMGIVAPTLAGLAIVGGMYVLMSDTRTKKAKRLVNKAMDDANNMISNKMNL